MLKIQCDSCDGQGKLSECCLSPSAPVPKQVDNYIKDGIGYVVMANSNTWICSTCGKFCKVNDCIDCNGTGYENK